MNSIKLIEFYFKGSGAIDGSMAVQKGGSRGVTRGQTQESDSPGLKSGSSTGWHESLPHPLAQILHL